MTIKTATIPSSSLLPLLTGLSYLVCACASDPAYSSMDTLTIHNSTPVYRSQQTYQQERRPMQPTLSNLTQTPYSNLPIEYAAIVQAAEVMASPSAKRVLQQARVMSLDERRIVGGGCWDYLNEVFSLAGAGRDTLFKGTFAGGPYATSEQLQGGDWLYFINHGYNDGEHSGLFIGWVDKAQRQALILSYAGENRQEPARYSVYDVSHVYQIMRPVY